MENYPMLQKMHESAAEVRVLRRFLDWVRRNGLELCRMQDDERGTYVRDRRSEKQLLADYFGIDLEEAERERRSIIDPVIEGDSGA